MDTSSDGGEVGFTDGGAADPRMIPYPGYGSGFEVDVSTIAECGPPCTVDRTGHVHVNHQGGYDLYVGRPVAVDGHRAFYNPNTGTVLVIAPTWYASVGFSGGGRNRFSEAQLLGVARSLTVAPSLTDQGTWYDADTAIPERG